MKIRGHDIAAAIIVVIIMLVTAGVLDAVERAIDAALQASARILP